ncbi:hypothetical protein AB1N83_013237 [Pleurotus pulmonarius]
MVGMYGISISPDGYVIQYSCPAGLQMSEEFTWDDDITPFISYIYTLYIPHTGFPSRDPSISLSASTDPLGPPTWDIRDGDKVYTNCAVKVVGDPVTVGTTTRIKTRLIMNTWGEPLRECTSLVDFLKYMYDILEAHRWAIMERNIIHRDISHGNIFIKAKDVDEKKKNEFTGKKYRPIFVNEIIENEKNIDPTARLGDMDNAAELDRKLAISPTFVSKRIRMNDEPLRCRTGTPKFIARSPALGCLLVEEIYFKPMPKLPDELAAKYIEAYPNDRSGLRAFHDNHGTFHGGTFDFCRVDEKYSSNPDLAFTEFQHCPRHDAESVFWCMVAFLLVAVPVGSPQEYANQIKLNNAWKLIANHAVGDSSDVEDRRIHLLRAKESQWKTWLHPCLEHVAQLLVLLAVQVRPEWGLCDPPPHMLHLHEAMQRLILIHIADWKKNNKDVKFVPRQSRPAQVPDNPPPPQMSYTQSIDGQHVPAGALRKKRGSENIEEKEESQSKRRRGAEPEALDPPSLPPTPRLNARPLSLRDFHGREMDRFLHSTPGSASFSLSSEWRQLDTNDFYAIPKRQP